MRIAQGFEYPRQIQPVRLVVRLEADELASHAGRSLELLDGQPSRLVALMEGRHPIVELGHIDEVLLIAARSHDFYVQRQGAVEQLDRLSGSSQLVGGPPQSRKRLRDESLPRGFRVMRVRGERSTRSAIASDLEWPSNALAYCRFTSSKSATFA